MNEVWAEIFGYEGLYSVSNLGRVKSFKFKKERILSCGKKGKYNIVCLRKGNVAKMVPVHRLVAEAFLQNPNNFPVVNHIDGEKNNNIVTNLEWVSYCYNTKHAYRNGLIKKPKNRKLSSKDAIKIFAEYKNTNTKMIDLAKKYKVSITLVWGVVNRSVYKKETESVI